MKDKIKWKSATMELAEFLDDKFGFDILNITAQYEEEGDCENCYRWVEDNIDEEDILDELESLVWRIKQLKKPKSKKN